MCFVLFKKKKLQLTCVCMSFVVNSSTSFYFVTTDGMWIFGLTFNLKKIYWRYIFCFAHPINIAVEPLKFALPTWLYQINTTTNVFFFSFIISFVLCLLRTQHAVFCCCFVMQTQKTFFWILCLLFFSLFFLNIFLCLHCIYLWCWNRT